MHNFMLGKIYDAQANSRIHNLIEIIIYLPKSIRIDFLGYKLENSHPKQKLIWSSVNKDNG